MRRTNVGPAVAWTLLFLACSTGLPVALAWMTTL